MNDLMDLNTMFKGFMQTVGQNTSTVTQTLELHKAQLMNNERMIKDIYCKLDDIVSQTENNTNEIITIKENDRITSGQSGMIRKTAYKRICDFIDPKTVSWQKYSKMYFQDLYRYLRNYCYLQSPNSETRKKDYDNVMNGFTDWYPDEKKLKERADKNAENRQIAKNQGYMK